MDLQDELTDYKLKYEMELDKSKMYRDENEKNESKANELSEKHVSEMEELRTKVLVLQNTNHSLLMDKEELQRRNEKMQNQKNVCIHRSICKYPESVNIVD